MSEREVMDKVGEAVFEVLQFAGATLTLEQVHSAAEDAWLEVYAQQYEQAKRAVADSHRKRLAP